jgi:type I restriction enzyme M protein
VKTIWSTIGERDREAAVATNSKGEPEPDPTLRDTEKVPLSESIDEYFARNVLKVVPDAWIDATKTKIGYEIPFTRLFYEYIPPRPLADIDVDIKASKQRILKLIAEVAE